MGRLSLIARIFLITILIMITVRRSLFRVNDSQRPNVLTAGINVSSAPWGVSGALFLSYQAPSRPSLEFIKIINSIHNWWSSSDLSWATVQQLHDPVQQVVDDLESWGLVVEDVCWPHLVPGTNLGPHNLQNMCVSQK